MLLIDKNQKFSITLLYKKSQNDDLEILTKEPEEGACEKEIFEFRKPTWGDVRTIMMQSTIGGNLNEIDPMAFMEAKIRTLLTSWSLKDEKGKQLAFDNLGRFPPQVVIHLNNELDRLLGTEGLFGMKVPNL